MKTSHIHFIKGICFVVFYTFFTFLEFFFTWLFSSPCPNKNHISEFLILISFSIVKLILIIMYEFVLKASNKNIVIYYGLISALLILCLYPLNISIFTVADELPIVLLKNSFATIINLAIIVLSFLYLTKTKKM